MFGIASDTLVRVHPVRPAALPTATGWVEKLRARTAGLRVGQYDFRGRGTPSHRLGRINRMGHAPPPVPIGNGVTGGPESVRDG